MGSRKPLIVPEPMHIDSRKVALTGTLLFLAATLALLPFVGWLREHGHLIWLWTAIAGFALGILGYLLSGKHRREGRTD